MPLLLAMAGVHEIVEDHDGDNCRVVYPFRFKGSIYVLHAFQKKSKKGIQTPPQPVIDLIKDRLKRVLQKLILRRRLRRLSTSAICPKPRRLNCWQFLNRRFPLF